MRHASALTDNLEPHEKLRHSSAGNGGGHFEEAVHWGGGDGDGGAARIPVGGGDLAAEEFSGEGRSGGQSGAGLVGEDGLIGAGLPLIEIAQRIAVWIEGGNGGDS